MVALAAALVLAAPAAAQNPLQQSPGIPPPGTNDFACRSTAKPVPVILVHGTFADMTVSWNELAPLLKRDGYCVFALDLPRRAMAPIEESADRLAAFAREVLQRTGAGKVSYVGHSQGGMLARYVVKSRGLLDQAEDVVGLAPSSHGTTNPGAGYAGRWFDCPACLEQEAGSAFMQKVNTAPEAPEPAAYTVISTRYDEVVTPYQSQALSGTTVTNVVVQDKCPNDIAEHVNLIYDPIALQWVRDALARSGPATPAFVPDCAGFGTGGDSAPEEAPARRVELQRSAARLLPGNVVLYRVKCVGSQPCAGTLELRTGGRRIARAPFAIPAGTKQAIELRLGRQAASVVRVARRIRVDAVAVFARDGGIAERVNTRFTLRT